MENLWLRVGDQEVNARPTVPHGLGLAGGAPVLGITAWVGCGGQGAGGKHRASADRRKPELFTFLITGTRASAQPGVIPTDKVNRM